MKRMKCLPVYYNNLFSSSKKDILELIISFSHSSYFKLFMLLKGRY